MSLQRAVAPSQRVERVTARGLELVHDSALGAATPPAVATLAIPAPADVLTKTPAPGEPSPRTLEAVLSPAEFPDVDALFVQAARINQILLRALVVVAVVVVLVVVVLVS